MSASPRVIDQQAPSRAPVTVTSLLEKKHHGEKIVMVTAYDYPSATVVEAAGVDMVLVGDSAATTVLGLDSTVPATVDELVMLSRAVRRGLRTAFLVSDLPFGSYEASDLEAVKSAQRFVKEAGAQAVKLEGGGVMVDRARAIVAAGIPVVGHLGLTPQTATALGGLRAQGKSAAQATRMVADALALQEAGCCALVLEAIPAAVADELMPLLEIPVIGIGAGASTDGQVLVWHDLLGLLEGRTAKFVKQYAHLHGQMVEAVRGYATEVRQGEFPAREHTYAIAPEELQAFQSSLAQLHGHGDHDISGYPA
ncbi:3-methyl-2-oxobutanoate hydroxymethyltransferase [Patulibacter brassicae]|jgi:3-methyl-2-oxobutanoate hydroxymethyltransferase|uniref:3-methyl-2-oxobutanoate hydroxymethyltransferase n=1 Tax=Patulibacter brassicae TaxID=1705717 RepID=A0ABU4VFS7_9ACTN|nr:3-methyl-2-oxobutanoate hydroxymethyltransferase [Patulibacter brassicae]MDX8150554.1 3-methyl-2-oxobutanoate hydroxymethyltransferase [Patulibacter brassicae]